ncbi:MAG: anthranilate synthase component I [Limisphaerales bacterium]|jgi:anthranilate synthase component 1|nr:anthranilate synthase component I [Pedosphaera sp.]MEC9130022.1 anthranilate synthase component I [Verrucomicrobiota bacterium]HCB96963.1 anthranilate synthase component I [Verrucomicrobiales bacterium]HCQ84183.1 anthranilate synthase component I [Verrucomicrobiales bacterium]
MMVPDRDRFIDLAREGNMIAVSKTILADFETPVSAYQKLRGKGESFLFESVEGGEHLGRYSFVGCHPRAIIRQTEDVVELIEDGITTERYSVKGALHTPSGETMRDGLELVEKVMRRFKPVNGSLPSDLRFSGGAVGFIGYEFIHDVEPVVPRPPQNDLQTPVMYFMIADQLLAFDRVSQTITLIVNALVEDPADAGQEYDKACEAIEGLLKSLAQPCQHHPADFHNLSDSAAFESNMPKDTFLKHVQRSKAYIQAGDIIQVVGSQRFSAPIEASPLDVYRAARSINPSPYMFLLELNGFSLVGASPEIHVRCEDRQVEIRPIAGTRPRGKDKAQDMTHEKDLLADPKERAEHVMLVDLARNDIGRVCDYQSVEVKDLMIIERYSHVMHIVSQVEGRLSTEHTPYDLIRATFPAGTLSGAPKIRAMQIISELEQTARGPYGGCVGYFSFNGNLDCCITIRTALIKDGMAHVQAGGGWVSDSVPEDEFMETVNKSKAMIKAVTLAESWQS